MTEPRLGLLASTIVAVGCGAAPAAAPECPTATVAAPSPAAPVVSAAQAPVTSPYPVVPYDLPRAGDFGTLESVMAVEISSFGALSVDGKPAAEPQIVKLARAAHQRDAGLRVVIHADGSAPWERVIRVMDLVRQGGASKIAFGVAPVSP